MTRSDLFYAIYYFLLLTLIAIEIAVLILALYLLSNYGKFKYPPTTLDNETLYMIAIVVVWARIVYSIGKKLDIFPDWPINTSSDNYEAYLA